MLVSTDWENECGLPNDMIKGGIPISGIYDLSPLYHSWLQPTIQLDQEMIISQSPVSQIPETGPPLLISVGELESCEFRRQSEAYLSLWKDHGLQGELLIQHSENHFTSFRDLNDPESLLCKSIIDFMKLCM